MASPADEMPLSPATEPRPSDNARPAEVAQWAIDVGISRNAARLLELAGVDGKALRTMDAADLNEVGLSGSLTKRVLYARDTAPLPSAADASVNPFE